MSLKAMLFCALAAALLYGAFETGQKLKQAEWDRDNIERAEAEQKRTAAVDKELLDAHRKAADAEERAAENESNLREARRAASTKQLASCVERTQPNRAAIPAGEPARSPGAGGMPPASAGGEPAHGAPDIRLHWRFVGLHDAAFTGLDGQPLFRASAEFSADPARADTPSPYGLADLLDVQGENAVNFSNCRRRLVEVKTQLERAAAAWDRSARR